ncbi:LysR family transcriptional regulator [Bradyrhizobium liaoningense]
MQLSTLSQFLEIVRTGSVRRASEQLNIAPSAMSRQIANLEHLVGAKLFERHADGMSLTAEGTAFLKYAQRTVRDIDLARSEIDEIRGLRRGRVRIHSVEGAVAGYLFSAVAEFRGKYPGVTFEVVAAGNDLVIEALVRDEADIGIGFNPSPDLNVRVVAKLRKEIVAVASPYHPFAERSELSLQDLMGAEIAMLDASFGTRRLLDRAFRNADISVPFALTVNAIEMAKAFAKRNYGIAILPAFAARYECDHGELVAIPLSEPTLKRATVALCVRRDRELPRAVAAFLKLLQEKITLL